MGRFSGLVFIAITVVFVSILVFNNISAESHNGTIGSQVWEECPDDFIEYKGGISIDRTEEVCGIDDAFFTRLNNNDHVDSGWYDSLSGGGTQIESVQVIVKGKGCLQCTICNERETNADVWVWSNKILGNWKKLGTITVKHDQNYTLDATDWITPNSSGAYMVMIKNTGYQGQERCLWLDYVGLRIRYYEMGEERLWNSLEVDPMSIPKYSGLIAIGEITCTGGDCGNVDAYIRYSSSQDGEWHDVPASGAPLMYDFTPNPHPCGSMGHLDTCTPSWEVTGTGAGNYYMKMFLVSSSAANNETSPVMVSVNPGVLDVSGSLYSNGISLYGDVKLEANVECRTAPCGNANMIVRYRREGSGIFEAVGALGNLSTGNDNPQECGQLDPGSECRKSWYIKGNDPGNYQIRVSAGSDDPDVADDNYDLTLRISPLEAVGELSIGSVESEPGTIEVSGTSVLYGTVSCSTESCGDVLVYARSGGEIIESNGISTGEENPKLCPGMEAGDYCSVSWNMEGNMEGTYYLDLLAESGLEGVVSVTSHVTYLEVESPSGSIYFPFEPELVPGIIDVSETALLSAVVECDSPYCGESSALVMQDGNELGTSGGLVTHDQNPQPCDSYPCELSWLVNGSESGSYEITLTVTPDGPVGGLFRSYGLTVRDPERPGLSASLGSLESQYELGKPFTLSGEVRCDNGDCGEVNVYAKYKEGESDPWTHLSGSPPLRVSGNPESIELSSGESAQVEWTVTPDTSGSYIIGISADATDQWVMDSGTASRGLEVFRGDDIAIGIRSPEQGATLSRGDSFLAEAMITEGGYPMQGAEATVSSEGLFAPAGLEDSGSGVYSRTISVGSSAEKGSYILNFYVKKDSNTYKAETNVYVDPELEVSLDTDAYEYEILEKVIIQGRVLDNGKPVKATGNLRLACPSRTFKDIVLETDGSGNYLHEYLLSMATPPETCRFELDTVDSHGNYNSTSSEVRIVPSEKETYKVTFISPLPESRFRKGDSVSIRIEATQGGEPLEGAEVRCMNPLLEEGIFLKQQGGGVYEGDYTITRESPSGMWVLTCVASTQDGYFGRKSLNVYITPLDVRLHTISPSKMIFQPGEVADISIALEYPDGRAFENATVYLAIGSERVYLEESGEGVYGGEYEMKSQGVFTFDVYAEDRFGNQGTFPGEIVLTAGFSPVSLYWLVLPFAIAVLLLAGAAWKVGLGRGRVIREEVVAREPVKKKVDRKEEIRKRIGELERKLKNIEKSKDVVEQEYYDRKVDEKTFNRMVQNFEQEIIAVNVEIEELKKELSGL